MQNVEEAGTQRAWQSKHSGEPPLVREGANGPRPEVEVEVLPSINPAGTNLVRY